jgi:muramoyltetrapeptide carboxypeptidase
VTSRSRAVVFPPAVSPGDWLTIIAPSSPSPRDELWRGLAWLRARYRLRFAAGALVADGYLAGDDARRALELRRAIVDDEAKAIVAIRGGYGAMRVIEDQPWDELARRPKWIVGFSDITALHSMAWRAGVASIHAPHVAGLGRDAPATVRAAWLAALERPRREYAWRGLQVLHGGSARGTIVGGNLALIHAMAAARRLAIPEGAVLALEDVGEAPYRVDRMLTSLLLGDYLSSVSAVVFGHFHRCRPGPDGRSVEEVLRERTQDLGIPVLAGAPFGHDAHNEAFILGSKARVDGDALFFGQ